MSPKKITLEDLAVMVQTGFEDLRSELQNEMQEKFFIADKSFIAFRAEMADGFAFVHRRFDALEEIVHKQNHMLTDARLSHLEAAI